jgi:hypothetical protein
MMRSTASICSRALAYLVVQLQRELERARGVIAEQQAIVHAAFRAARGGER